jgi:hypothetical protein
MLLCCDPVTTQMKNMIYLGKTAKWVTRPSKFISKVSNVSDKLKVRIRLTIGQICPGIAMRQRERERQIDRQTARQTERERGGGEVKNLCATD